MGGDGGNAKRLVIEAVSIERQATFRVLLPSRRLLMAHNVPPPRPCNLTNKDASRLERTGGGGRCSKNLLDVNVQPIARPAHRQGLS